MRIFTKSSKEYLDALSGRWCVNVGYGNQHIANAISHASSQLSFAHNHMGWGSEDTIRLSDKLIALSGGNMRKVFFGNSGSDAMDTNLKLARLYHVIAGSPNRKKFIARCDAYHGTTLARASLSGFAGFHHSFGLTDSSFIHVSAPDIYRFVDGNTFDSEESYADWLAIELDAKILKENPNEIAAFVAEPIMSVGGLRFPPRTYFTKVKRVLDKYGILFIIDDVVCSFGRLGSWFGWQTLELGVVSDLVAVAKGLARGYIPISASIVGDRVWRMMETHAVEIGSFGHGFTTSGHPVAAAAALANIEVIETDNLLIESIASGAYMLASLRAALGSHPNVGDIRGAGLLLGVEFVADKRTGRRFRESGVSAGSVMNLCLEMGFVVRALPVQDIIAFAPPLNITRYEIGQVVDVFVAAVVKHADSLTHRT
jgi:L-2,4-diaminobutyrate transaminase